MVFIKKVRIKGFKSYNELDMDSFSKKHNCIVGRNGSGKSNFFFAIRFVLSDDSEFNNITPERRQQFLHAGAGSSVMSAFVELHFDNSDHRFPVESDVVILRRQIGLTKDEYFLNKKHVTKNDVRNLLESAGFSRANPYYIVQQGKVTEMAKMEPRGRLHLLKEVAGTTVYDERKDESLKLLEDTAGKLEKIEDVLGGMETRLTELETEKDELVRYQELDKTRRGLEYTLHKKRLDDALDQLERVDEDRAGESEKAKKFYALAVEAQEKLKKKKDDLRRIEANVEELTTQVQALESELLECNQERATYEVTVKDLKLRAEHSKEKETRLKEEADSLSDQVTETKSRLEETKKAYLRALNSERDLKTRSLDTQRQLDDLFAKMGRRKQFKTPKARDAWIRKEMGRLDAQIDTESQQGDDLSSEVEELQSALEKCESDSIEIRKQMQKFRDELEQKDALFKGKERDRDDAQNSRKQLWQKEAELNNTMRETLEDHRKSMQNLRCTIPKVVSVGLEAVEEIAKEHEIEGVYGPLIELFDCPPEFTTAAEVTAGGSLFHVVVDNDETASRILDIMHDTGVRGRVTFMPLNRLNPRIEELPRTKQVRPILDQLDITSDLVRPAFRQVFGSTLVCRDLEVAANFAKTRNVNCITIEGDQVKKKGALRGGFYDTRFSRIGAMRSIKLSKEKLALIKEESATIASRLVDVDQVITNAASEMQAIESRRSIIKNEFEHLNEQLLSKLKEQDATARVLEEKQKMSSDRDLSLHQLRVHRDSLNAELGTKLKDGLSPKEQEKLSELQLKTTELKDELASVSDERANLESDKLHLMNLLTENLEKRRREIDQELNTLSLTEDTRRLDEATIRLESTAVAISSVEERLSSVSSNLDDLQNEAEDAKGAVEDLKVSAREYAHNVQTESKSLEKLLNKRSLQLQTKEDCERKIRDLGSLPAGNERWQDLSERELIQELAQVNAELDGEYADVNKKALDQYVSFTQQRSVLVSRKEELDKGKQAIEDLIRTLDRKKDEAIERTFKGVALKFGEVFGELVPDGAARLVILKERDSPEDERSSSEPVSKIAQFTGVDIKVSFVPGARPKRVENLSGGQNSLVALALIFAIQRLDPAPFYLFDEIDSALDVVHRDAVAKLLERQSAVTQFVTTTFKPELVSHADKFFGISFAHRSSKIREISRANALAIIEESAAGPEAAGLSGRRGGVKRTTKRRRHVESEPSSSEANE